MFSFGKFFLTHCICADQSYSDKLRNRKGNEMTGKMTFSKSLKFFEREKFCRFREVSRDGEGRGDSS